MRCIGDKALLHFQVIAHAIQPLVEAFNDLLDRMRDNLEVQQRFIADAAHQLKTPLTALKTQAQLAMYEDEPEALRGSLQRIGSSVDRASHLVSQLLTLARAESTGDVQAETRVDMATLVREVAEEWVLPAAQKHLELDFEAPPAGAPVFGNAFLLREMVSNLIDNAIRYSPAGTVVAVTIRQHGKEVCLQVTDQGPGIPAHERDRVLGRFTRLAGSDAPGSGLGLSIALRIAELHQATLSLSDGAGGYGLCVRLDMPAAPAI